MPGQPDVHTAQETLPETFQDSLQELSQDSLQELSQDSSQDSSQDLAPMLADPDLTIDAARLGTWIHAQLQEIPLDRSGPYTVLGRCDLSKTRFPRWLETQKQHAIHLLEGYNLIIGNADRSPTASERLAHSWSEFEFRIKASDSLELIGVIDRLDIVETPDGFRAVISDYKSNHIQDDKTMQEKAAYYAIQLQVYAWAISRMPIWQGKPVEVVRGELYFLDAGQSVTVDVGCDERAKAVDSLIQALPDLLGLLGQEGYPMKEGDACTWCQHGKVCDTLNTLIPA
jgi:ATP-dependent exoDNAse (exonuclease V) beta subunit